MTRYMPRKPAAVSHGEVVSKSTEEESLVQDMKVSRSLICFMYSMTVPRDVTVIVSGFSVICTYTCEPGTCHYTRRMCMAKFP